MKIKYRPTLIYSLTALFSILILSSVTAQTPLISKVYEWNNLPVKGKYGTQVRSILKGETRSLEMFEIKAVTLIGGYFVKEYKISKGVEELIIVKRRHGGYFRK